MQISNYFTFLTTPNPKLFDFMVDSSRTDPLVNEKTKEREKEKILENGARRRKKRKK